MCTDKNMALIFDDYLVVNNRKINILQSPIELDDRNFIL